MLQGDDQRNLIMADDDERPEALEGGGGFDWMEGATERQEISGGGGDDYMEGRGGPDRLEGGEGHDSLFGGDGDDRLIDDSGPIALNGEARVPTRSSSTAKVSVAPTEARDRMSS